MTIMNLPTVRYEGKLENGYVTCKQGTKEIKSAIVADEEISGLFGGGDHMTVTMPLWDYLTGWEKKAVKRAIYLFNKGDMAQLAVENDGVTNLNKILKNIHAKALAIPREKRTTRKGIRYGTWNDNHGNQPGYAGTMERRKI